MKKYLLIVIFAFNTAQAQPVVTAEQLLEQSRNADQAIAVAMYLSGWRDAASAGLLHAAVTLRESGAEIGQNADYEEAMGRCLGRLEVADLIQKLRQKQTAGEISPTGISAGAALLEGVEELCEEEINEALLAGN